MIKVDNLYEYQSIVALSNYCISKSYNECEGCVLKDLCDCMSIIPRDLKIEYKDKKGVKDDD